MFNYLITHDYEIWKEIDMGVNCTEDTILPAGVCVTVVEHILHYRRPGFHSCYMHKKEKVLQKKINKDLTMINEGKYLKSKWSLWPFLSKWFINGQSETWCMLV